MKQTNLVMIITAIFLLLLTGMVSSELTDDNKSISTDQNASLVRAGDMALVHMIMMATGPVLATETDEDFEGSWAFNCEDDGSSGGGIDPYDIGYDPFDSGYDPFDTGYDPFNTGTGGYDPYNTGIIGGVVNPGSLQGTMFPIGSQMVNPSSGSVPGGYTDVIDAFGQLFKKYPVNTKKPPVKNPPVPTVKQPSGFNCVLGICDCTGYQIYCQPNYVLPQGAPGMWKTRCCGNYNNPFGRY